MCLPFRKWILTVVGTKWDTHHGFFWRLLGKCIISSVDCYVERSEIWKQWLRKEAVRIWVSLGKGWFRLDENNDSHCLIVRSFWSIPTKSLRIREFSTMRKTLALHVYIIIWHHFLTWLSRNSCRGTSPFNKKNVSALRATKIPFMVSSRPIISRIWMHLYCTPHSFPPSFCLHHVHRPVTAAHEIAA